MVGQSKLGLTKRTGLVWALGEAIRWVWAGLGCVGTASVQLEGLAQGVKPKWGEEGFLQRVSLMSEPMRRGCGSHGDGSGFFTWGEGGIPRGVVWHGLSKPTLS